MGTRNYTRVIKGGEIVVNQYCQWDGYPTSAGRVVLNFVRERDMAAFARKLDGARLLWRTSDKLDALKEAGELPPEPRESWDDGEPLAEYCTGAPVTRRLQRARELYDGAERCYFEEHSGKEGSRTAYEGAKRYARLAVTHALGEDAYRDYLAASRDTGADILAVIADAPSPLTLYSDSDVEPSAVEDEIGGIEAVYVINLDRNTVTMRWHDKELALSFGEVRAMAEGELEKMLEDLERAGYED